MGRPDRGDRQLILAFLGGVIAKGKIDGTHCKEAFIKSVNTADRSEATAASASQILAEMAAWKITEKLATLDEVRNKINFHSQKNALFFYAVSLYSSTHCSNLEVRLLKKRSLRPSL